MADRGAIERVGRGRWRIAALEPEPEPEPIEPEAAPEPGAQSRWVSRSHATIGARRPSEGGLRYG
jgi:hypothetical protein